MKSHVLNPSSPLAPPSVLGRSSALGRRSALFGLIALMFAVSAIRCSMIAAMITSYAIRRARIEDSKASGRVARESL